MIEDGHKLIRKYELKTRGISEFTKVLRPTEPFLFTIDIEGLDYCVLKAIDWSCFHPRVVCVENPGWLNNDDKIRMLMESNGYKLVSIHFISAIFVSLDY